MGMFIAGYKQQEVSIERMCDMITEEPLEVLVEHGPVYERGKLLELAHLQKGATHRLEMLDAHGLSYHYPGSTAGK